MIIKHDGKSCPLGDEFVKVSVIYRDGEEDINRLFMQKPFHCDHDDKLSDWIWDMKAENECDIVYYEIIEVQKNEE
jgi:hypothetical protein